MARARLVKPTFFANEDLATLPPLGRLLFIGLWTVADREGRMEDRPTRIKGQIFPYERVNVEPLLQRLCELGFIERYTSEGVAVIAIPSFLKHQNPHHREAPSTLPGRQKPRESPRPALGQPEAEPRLGAVEPSTSRAVAVTGNRYTVTGDPVTGSGSGTNATGGGVSDDVVIDDPIVPLLRLWERATGTLAPPIISDQMDAMIGSGVPQDWIADAIRETGEQGSKSWKYTAAILDRWKREGRHERRADGNGAPGTSLEQRIDRYTGGPLGHIVNTGGER